MYGIYMYICLKCTQFLKINAGNSLSECKLNKGTLTKEGRLAKSIGTCFPQFPVT